MTQSNQIDMNKVELDIANLMIESDNQEDNAYNWGLAHAVLLFNGGDVGAIKEQRDRMRNVAQ
jgi:hypothetical protein